MNKTKLTLQICYGFYREWSTCKERLETEKENQFWYHLLSNRAYQTREHLNRHFPKWMLDACAKMLRERQTEYEFNLKMRVTNHKQHLKEIRLNPDMSDIPF